MWKTLNPIWQTLILILLIAGAVPTIYFCGYKSSAKKAEAEKAEVIATYQASALVADTLAPNAGRLNQQGRDLTALLVQDLQRGETEDNILDRLAEQFPNMDDTALQNELARVIFLSGLVGRIEAAQEMS